MRALRHGNARLVIAAALIFACAMVLPALAATVTIVNQDGPSEGFNDPTAASPVGGNPGTTIGAQRLYVFQYAANLWGSILSSSIAIRVAAQFNPLSCTTTSGVLGQAGPVSVWKDFAGAPVAGHWYHVALANKLSNSDLDPSDDISITFNSGIGGASCLPEGWYYGVDGNEGGQIELLPVVLHEMGHGLGFSTMTSGSSGNYFNGSPHIYDRFLLDNTNGLHWDQMTAGQRTASAVGCTRLVWDGPSVTNNAPSRLNARPILRVNSPGGIAGDYIAGTATFGPSLSNSGVTGNVVLANDGVGTVTNACEPLVNAAAINGNIALVDRGACTFVTKVKNAQNAGAIAVIVADSVPGCPPAGMSGSDPTITIPSLRITQADGNTLKANLVGLNVSLMRNPAELAGTDASGRLRMYSPSTFAGGSSVSHWDVTADPDLLMEPALTRTLSSDVDLTRYQLADIGWFNEFVGVGDPARTPWRLLGNIPNPFHSVTDIRFTLERDQEVELGVYDLVGRLVAELGHGPMPEGSHTVRWNGLERDGRVAAPGIYVYRLRAGGRVESRPMVLFR